MSGQDPSHHPTLLDYDMLCREQRTALTTARDRRQARTHLDQIVLRLTTLVLPRIDDVPHRTPVTCKAPSPKNSTVVDDFCDGGCASDDDRCGSSTAKRPFSRGDYGRDSDRIVAASKHIKKLSWPKFGEVFLCVILISLVQYSCAAPRRSRLTIRSMDYQDNPKWINPCGVASNDYTISKGDSDDSTLYDAIVYEANIAIEQTKEYRNGYVKEIFKVDFDEHHSSWRHVVYEWLSTKQNTQKSLGENVSSDHLKAVEDDMQHMLANLYVYLQTIAVGLEQAANDQEKFDAPFKRIFDNGLDRVSVLLCEIQDVMNEKGVKPYADVTRENMPDEYKNLSSESNRNLRDWIIFREYINALEYVVQVFEYLKSNAQIRKP